MAKTLTKDYFDEQFDKMGQAIALGFEGTATKDGLAAVENRLDHLETKVDVIQGKLDNILYKEIAHIETRVKKIEQHLGLKPV